MIRLCQQCGEPLPTPSSPRRRWCDDACRKRAGRTSSVRAAEAGPVEDGPVLRAIQAMLEELGSLDRIDRARLEVALAMAAQIDRGVNPVQAARALLVALSSIDELQAEDTAAWIASIQTPFPARDRD